ncbi:outer membrane lipoprotein-sorting protein [Oceanospirillum beijerinckii]|uniref:outer membrane lipoprotein-sorting protein n=1 Tax=Oceanospirillum beijerinckii TaxID=64976 RepID=UPI000409E56B|nr:outer membrane lipoprotein-sorting protein [Oceanospirillum beijerinckii]
MALNNLPHKLALTGLSLCVTLSPLALAQSVEDKGRSIMEEYERRDTGWQDMQAEMQMILRNAQGQESIREIRMKSLEQENDGDKSLTIFDEPRDVKGTAFLSFSHINKPDDQWLYLPALGRVKRISSRNKSGPFMGSEFSYEDMGSFEIDKYTYKYLTEEACGKLTCYVVESYPVEKTSGYTRRISWVDTTEYRMQKLDFYDRKNERLKTLNFTGYQQYVGQYWRADKMEMQNHQNGKSTVLAWKDYRFKQGLDERDFNKNALKRAR